MHATHATQWCQNAIALGMRISRTTLILGLSLSACQAVGRIFGTSPIGAPAALDVVDVVWSTPSDNARGSMPLGNGEVVVNAWVEAKTGDLMLLVVRTDCAVGDVPLPQTGAIAHPP